MRLQCATDYNVIQYNGEKQIFGVAESRVLNSRDKYFKSSQQSIFTVEDSMAYYLENQTENVENKLRYFSL